MPRDTISGCITIHCSFVSSHIGRRYIGFWGAVSNIKGHLLVFNQSSSGATARSCEIELRCVLNIHLSNISST